MGNELQSIPKLSFSEFLEASKKDLDDNLPNLKNHHNHEFYNNQLASWRSWKRIVKNREVLIQLQEKIDKLEQRNKAKYRMKLTSRQIEMKQLIEEGLSIPQVAEKLGCTTTNVYICRMKIRKRGWEV